MKLQKVVFAFVGSILLLTGSVLAQQAKIDYDRSANFSQYKTYS